MNSQIASGQTACRVFTADDGLVNESVFNLFEMFTGDSIYRNLLCAIITSAFTLHTCMTECKAKCPAENECQNVKPPHITGFT